MVPVSVLSVPVSVLTIDTSLMGSSEASRNETDDGNESAWVKSVRELEKARPDLLTAQFVLISVQNHGTTAENQICA